MATAAPQHASVQRADPQRTRTTPAAQAPVALRPAVGRARAFAGNRTIHRLLNSPAIQPKLTVGPVDDEYEREADRVADRVMRMPDPPPAPKGNHIQRACKHCEEEKARRVPLAIQRMCAECEEEEEEEEAQRTPLVSARATPAPAGAQSGGVAPEAASSIAAATSGGSALPDSTRAYFEPRFGRDFSHVRIHTGAEAARSATAINARAYTLGRNIVFGSSEYSPDSIAGRRLLAHELVHTVQQGEGRDATAIQRVCGPGPIAAAVGARTDCTDNFDNTFVPGAIFRFKKDCDEFEAGQDASLLLTALLLLPTASTFEIHGFASVDGPLTFNQNLGCARAVAARNLLGTIIPASRITAVVNHGEVPGPTADRRSVSIVATLHTITSETVEPSPAPRTRTTIGVGEEVTLTHAPGNATWTASAGALSGAFGVSVTWTAPDTTQTVTVTASAASITFNVIAPSQVNMDRAPGTGVKHTLNSADSGIQTRVFLGPDTVNFSKVTYHEMDVPGVPTAGAYSCNTFSTGHCGAGGAGPCPNIAMTSAVFPAFGTLAARGDCAYSGHCGGSPPFTPGSITLTIPYEYRVGTGPFRNFRTVTQRHSLAANASTLTTTKAGATGTTTVTSATVTIAACP
jgi:hypothetical protein